MECAGLKVLSGLLPHVGLLRSRTEEPHWRLQPAWPVQSSAPFLILHRTHRCPGDLRPTASYGLPSPALQVLLMRKALQGLRHSYAICFCTQATGAGLEAPKETSQQTVALPFAT